MTYANIAILKLSSLGDIIHTLPAFNLLRKRYPDARISWIVEPAGAKLLENFSSIDEIIVIHLKTPTILNKLKEVRRVIAKHRKKFDLILDFQGLLKSAVLSYLLKSYTVGFNRDNLREPAARLFYKKKADIFDEKSHVVFKNIHLINSVENGAGRSQKKSSQENKISTNNSIEGSATPANKARHTIPAGLKKSSHENKFLTNSSIEYPPLKKTSPGEMITRFFAEHKLAPKKYYILNVGGGWETKILHNNQYIHIVDRLKEQLPGGNPIVILWGNEKEKKAAEKISRETGALMSAFLSFADLITFIKQARFIITADTLSLHIADMVGTPSAGIFGPTSPRRNGSLLEESRAVYENLSCNFCYKKKCGTIECIKKLNLEEIVQAVEKINEKCG